MRLIQTVKEEIGLSKKEAADVVNIFFESIADALANGDNVDIRGFGSLKIKEYKPYIARNPKTGEKVQIPAKKLPTFKAGKALKEKVDR